MRVFSFIPSHYPQNPGCYLMRDEQGKVIYVGKAKNLRKRLGQYFQAARSYGKVARLIKEVQDVDVILVSNELESLILENNLIKRHKPRFNVMLVPDESGYGYIVQTAELYPRLLPYRKNRINKALGRTHPKEIEVRYGPYLSNTIRDELIKCVSELCGLRTCDPIPHKVCFLFHLKRCLGPCERYVIVEEYLQAVEKAGVYLSAPHLHLIDHLTAQMQMAAEAMEFERASHIRDQIRTLKTVFERQSVERDLKHDQDVVFWQDSHALILHLVRGALIGIEWLPDTLGAESPESFLRQHYIFHSPASIPAEIIVPETDQPAVIEQELAAAGAHPVKVCVPVRGAARDLIEIARLNWAYQVSRIAQEDTAAGPAR